VTASSRLPIGEAFAVSAVPDMPMSLSRGMLLKLDRTVALTVQEHQAPCIDR